MPQRAIRFAWARGLGGTVVRLGAGLALVMALLVVAMVWATKDTPPVNAAIYHPEPDAAHHEALLVGTLQRSPECITVVAEGQVWTPIFPSDDVRLQHDAVVYQGVEFRNGDQISLGGGEASAPPAGSRIPADCPPGMLWRVSP